MIGRLSGCKNSRRQFNLSYGIERKAWCMMKFVKKIDANLSSLISSSGIWSPSGFCNLAAKPSYDTLHWLGLSDYKGGKNSLWRKLTINREIPSK